MQFNRKLITVFVLALVGFMVSSSAASANAATIQKLPTCVDPTSHNLPCTMVISTLPPPPNSLQCQESSGGILACSYTTQNLSNGEQIVIITVYVPANFVFSSPTAIKVVEHETITKTTTKTKIVLVTPCSPTHKWNPLIHKCVDKPICHSTLLTPCPPPPPPPKPTCDSKYYTGPCPPTDENAYTKCISAALAASDDKNGLACARLLPDTPENAYAKCISEALFNDDTIAGLKCAKLLPSTNRAINNMTNTTTSAPTSPDNTSAAIQPSNTSIPASEGKGTGSTCTAGNCTVGTTPAVDCTKNPNDPSCTQSSISPATPPSSPTTKTCPDGSVTDASASCPTQSTPPPTNPPPSPDNNNPTPPSNNNHNDNGNQPSSNSDKGGDKSSGGSDKSSGGDKGGSQPTTTS